MENGIFNTAKKYVVQSYELINSKLLLSSVELNLLYCFITQIDTEDKDFKQYKVHKKDIEKMIGLELDFNSIDKATTNLMRPFKIETRNIADKNSFKKRNLFSSIDFSNNEFSFRFNEEMKEHLIGLKNNFVSAKFIGTVSKMKSIYSKRIYFMLKQRLLLKTWTIEVDILRDKLVDPKSESLNIFNNFKRKVLDMAMIEINNHSDIKFDYKVIKEGRTIKSLKFNISKNNNFTDLKKNSSNSVNEWLEGEAEVC